MLDAYGTCELVRTGRIALGRGGGAITDEPAGRRGCRRCRGLSRPVPILKTH